MVLFCAVTLVATAGCGDEDFKNERRAPVEVELTGVITPRRVIVSPDRVGAGPVEITITNQSEQAYTLTLQGPSVRERVGPINPEDTANIQKTLKPGTYKLRARATEPGARPILAAELVVGPPRKSSNDRLLLP